MFLAAAAAGAAPVALAEDRATDIHAACRIPFERLKDPKTGEFFPLSAAINDNEKLASHLRQRYLVADLNSADADGMCRGVQEIFAPIDALSDFARLRAVAPVRRADFAALRGTNAGALAAASGMGGEQAAALAVELEDLQNYLEQVDRFRTDPIDKPRVFNGYCIGQTLNLCEIVDGEPRLVYRFVTSSSRSPPPLNRYYAPMNLINTRNWSGDRSYGAADARRDARLGGGDARIIPFHNGGNPIPMPNFMHFVPAPGYMGSTGNGIHEIAGGLDSGGTFGAPVSLGCIRLNKYQAKLARWWVPRQAKFFVYFEPNQYRHFGDATTGKARGAPAVSDQTARSPAAAPPSPEFAPRVGAAAPLFPFLPFARLLGASE
ncbi:MAG TPA: L,D-transpeptidase [Xanthobacteraceae bacterium]|nr:L,D-transpeptidase [Xanthobacteraceae bacterium]